MNLSNEDVISDIQRLAKIGYWTYDYKTTKFDYSKKLMSLCLEEDYSAGLDFEHFFNFVYEDDKERIANIINNNSGVNNLNYDFEFRLKSSNGNIKHLKIIVSKKLDKEGNLDLIQGIIQDISELRESQMDLKIHKDRLSFAVDTIDMGIWEWDVNKDISVISPNVYRIAKLSEEIPLTQAYWRRNIHADDIDNVKKAISACVNGQIPVYSCDYRYIKPDGDIIWISSKGAASGRDSNNKALKIIGVIFDITERKLAEQKLKISENRLRTAQQLTMLGNWEVNLENGTSFWSNELYRIFETTHAENPGNTDLFLSKIHEDDLDYVKRHLETLYSGGSSTTTCRIHTFKGKLKYIEEHAYSIKNKQGKIIKFIGTTQDITYSKMAEEKIRLSEQRLREAQKTAKIGTWELSTDKLEIIWSDEVFNIFGYEPNEVKLTPEFVLSHIFKESHEELITFLETLQEGDVHSITYKILANNGQVKYIKDTVYCKRDKNNEIVNYVGNIQDITELKRKEQQIIDSRERLKRTAKLAKLGYWEYFVDSQKLVIHELYSDDLDKNALGNNPSINDLLKILDKEDQLKVMTGVRTMIKYGKDSEITIRLKKETGDIWLLVKASCHYSNNHLIKLYGHVQDVTESHRVHLDLIKAKEKAEESDRLKSAFLANMSHEIRTPMNSIMGFSNLITDDLYSIKEKTEFADTIHKNSEVLLQLITDILDLSLIEAKSIQIDYADISINTLLEDLYLTMKDDTYAFELVFVPLDEDLVINTDKKRVTQILNNFLSNAIKYTSKGSVEIGAVLLDNSHISLFIKDTGIGISEDHLYKIFDRFKQLDDFTNGVGLGLSICKGLADIMEYELNVESLPNIGSIFSIDIPLD
ncbi:MAG: PAS domain-containing protein [Marinifilaceae bacterium]